MGAVVAATAVALCSVPPDNINNVGWPSEQPAIQTLFRDYTGGYTATAYLSLSTNGLCLPTQPSQCFAPSVGHRGYWPSFVKWQTKTKFRGNSPDVFTVPSSNSPSISPEFHTGTYPADYFGESAAVTSRLEAIYYCPHNEPRPYPFGVGSDGCYTFGVNSGGTAVNTYLFR